MRTRIITLFRRWLLLWALMFWQGGFMFYGGVVVPVGSTLLGSDREQGFITRSVTNYLNIAGAVALAFWCWDLAATRGRNPRGHQLCWAVWGGLVLALAALVGLHWKLDGHLVPEDHVVREQQRFRALHEVYIFISSAQWAGCLVLTALTLWLWRDVDGISETHPIPGER